MLAIRIVSTASQPPLESAAGLSESTFRPRSETVGYISPETSLGTRVVQPDYEPRICSIPSRSTTVYVLGLHAAFASVKRPHSSPTRLTLYGCDPDIRPADPVRKGDYGNRPLSMIVEILPIVRAVCHVGREGGWRGAVDVRARCRYWC